LIREIGQKEGGVDLQRVELGLLFAHLATVRGLSADGPRRANSPAVLRVRRMFLRVFCSIRFAGLFLVHEVLECWMVRDEADSPRVHQGQSIFLSALLEVRVAILDGPP
jgi:hypothetical protein